MLRGVFQSDQKRQVGVGTRLGQGIQGPRQFKVPGMPLGSQGICTPGGRRPEQPGAASDGLLSTPALNALNPTTAWTTARSRPAAAVSVQQAAFRLPAAPLGSPKQAPKEGGPRALPPWISSAVALARCMLGGSPPFPAHGTVYMCTGRCLAQEGAHGIVLPWVKGREVTTHVRVAWQARATRIAACWMRQSRQGRMHVEFAPMTPAKHS